MARPPLYLDECVHTDLIPALRKRGPIVTSARDEGLANRHIPDDAQLDYATQLQHLLQRGVRLSGYSEEDAGIALGR